MEKEMLAIAFFKEGDGLFEKFMGFMQSEVGMGARRQIAHVEKTLPSVSPMKNYVMFKVHVHDEQGMIDFCAGRNPVTKATWDECIDHVDLFELTSTDLG